jgi:hypothetical protein
MNKLAAALGEFLQPAGTGRPPAAVEPNRSSAADRSEPRPGFVARLANWLGLRSDVAQTIEYEMPSADQTALVAREAIRFQFVGFGVQAPLVLQQQDLLYLDVGNGLRPGVIDHHQLADEAASTTSLVRAYPQFIQEAVKPWREPTAPFTILLHHPPDLDGVAAAALAVSFLVRGRFPAGSEALGSYLDQVDAGTRGMSIDQPFSLYAAWMQLLHRLGLMKWKTPQDMWTKAIQDGLELVDYVLDQVVQRGKPIRDLDAFDCPGLFRDQDRAEILADQERYQRKLADPHCRASRAVLRLPLSGEGRADIEMLFVRYVQNADDPQRCIFFKDWARTDRKRCPTSGGFTGLCVFMPEGAGSKGKVTACRCIISLRSDSRATLCGLGELLEREETAWRKQFLEIDERVVDPQTGESKLPREGYANADPWYDGRAHGYTIVDAPHSGTKLSADDLERLVLEFGGRTRADLRPVDEDSTQTGRGSVT